MCYLKCFGMTFDKTAVHDFLDNLGIRYEAVTHKAVFKMEEFSAISFPHPEAVAKNLFVCDDKKQNYYLITVKGEKRIDLKAFKQKYDTRHLSLAKEEDLKSILGLKPGAVSPLGILNDTGCKVSLFLDEDFMAPPHIIGIHPNENTATVNLKAEDLVHIITAHGNTVRIVQF